MNSLFGTNKTPVEYLIEHPEHKENINFIQKEIESSSSIRWSILMKGGCLESSYNIISHTLTIGEELITSKKGLQKFIIQHELSHSRRRINFLLYKLYNLFVTISLIYIGWNISVWSYYVLGLLNTLFIALWSRNEEFTADREACENTESWAVRAALIHFHEQSNLNKQVREFLPFYIRWIILVDGTPTQCLITHPLHSERIYKLQQYLIQTLEERLTYDECIKILTEDEDE